MTVMEETARSKERPELFLRYWLLCEMPTQRFGNVQPKHQDKSGIGTIEVTLCHLYRFSSLPDE